MVTFEPALSSKSLWRNRPKRKIFRVGCPQLQLRTYIPSIHGKNPPKRQLYSSSRHYVNSKIYNKIQNYSPILSTADATPDISVASDFTTHQEF